MQFMLWNPRPLYLSLSLPLFGSSFPFKQHSYCGLSSTPIFCTISGIEDSFYVSFFLKMLTMLSLGQGVNSVTGRTSPDLTERRCPLTKLMTSPSFSSGTEGLNTSYNELTFS